MIQRQDNFESIDRNEYAVLMVLHEWCERIILILREWEWLEFRDIVHTSDPVGLM